MARLWAKQIISGKKTLEDVPERLKAGVSEILIEDGKSDLVKEIE